MIRFGKSWFVAACAVLCVAPATDAAQAGGLQVVTTTQAVVSPLVVVPFTATPLVTQQVVAQQVFVPNVIVQQRVVRQRVQVLGTRRIVVQGLHCR